MATFPSSHEAEMGIWSDLEDESMNGKSDLASYLKKKWENVLGDPNAQRYVSKGNEIPPRSANLQDSSSNQAPTNQNNVNSP